MSYFHTNLLENLEKKKERNRIPSHHGVIIQNRWKITANSQRNISNIIISFSPTVFFKIIGHSLCIVCKPTQSLTLILYWSRLLGLSFYIYCGSKESKNHLKTIVPITGIKHNIFQSFCADCECNLIHCMICDQYVVDCYSQSHYYEYL